MTNGGKQIKDVDIALGDEFSRQLYAVSQQTQQYRPGMVSDLGGTFSGWRGIKLEYFAECMSGLYIYIGLDGIGTKPELYERRGNHYGAAFDLFAMCGDDAVTRGGEVFGIGTILDLNQLTDTPEVRQVLQQLLAGYAAAAQALNVVVLNGEVAELGHRVQGYGPINYNWGGVALYAVHEDRILNGSKIKPGDAVIGLVEPGLRSNGITDVRKALLARHGEEWQHVVVPELGGRPLGEIVSVPSTIYSRFITTLTGGYNIRRQPLATITGVAHITGGGQPSKIGRMLRPTNGLGVEISDPIPPPVIMSYIQRLRGFDDQTIYGKMHMGPGMIVTTPEPSKVLAAAGDYGIEAKQIGEVNTSGRIEIKSCGTKTPGKYLSFEVD